MIKKIYLLPVVVCFFLFTAFTFGSIHLRSLLDGDSGIIIIEKEIESENPYIKAHLRFPKIMGLENEKIQSIINYNFESDIRDLKAQVENAASEEYKKAREKNVTFTPYSAQSDFKAAYNKNGMLSIIITCDYSTQNSEKGFFFKTRNIDINTGKSLKLKEIFKYNANYKGRIINEIENQIKNNPSLNTGNIMNDIKNLMEDQPFYLTDSSVVICYQAYGNSPSPKPIEFCIPYSSLEKDLKQQFIEKEKSATP